VEEINGFANRVTLLADGRVRFRGSVVELLAAGGLAPAAPAPPQSTVERAFLALTGEPA
jgi:ABC-type molybdate transport system ATPase subunit